MVCVYLHTFFECSVLHMFHCRCFAICSGNLNFLKIELIPIAGCDIFDAVQHLIYVYLVLRVFVIN